MNFLVKIRPLLRPLHDRYVLPVQNTICLFESPEVDPDKTIPRHYLVKIEEDKHGRLHLLNPLTSSKRRTPMALDIRNFRFFKLGHKIFSAHACMKITMKAVFPALEFWMWGFLIGQPCSWQNGWLYVGKWAMEHDWRTVTMVRWRGSI